MKRAVVILFLCLGGFGGLFLYARSKSMPPKEAMFIRNFYAHRTSYERLRDMLIADKQVIRIGKWGVATQSTLFRLIPPDGEFPVARYNDYMTLLKETWLRGKPQRRRKRDPAWPGDGVFAGNTRHVGICWCARSRLTRSLRLMATGAESYPNVQLCIGISHEKLIYGRI